METKDTIYDQRSLVTSSASSLGIIGTRFPTLNRLMGSIQNRKTRETVVLALVISACICFTLWYLFGGTAAAAPDVDPI
jgi:Golgi SNAP receptor complex protein 1